MSPNNKSSPMIWYDRYVHRDHHNAVGNQSKPKRTEPTSYNSSIDGLHPLARSRLLPRFGKSSNPQAIEALNEVIQPLNQTHSQDLPFRSAKSGKIDHRLRRPSRPRIMTTRSHSQIKVHRAPSPQTYASVRLQQSTVPVYPSGRPTKLSGTMRRCELHDIPGAPSRPLRCREANTRQTSRPQIMADRSHSPRAETFQPNIITDHRPHIFAANDLRGKLPNQPYDAQHYKPQDAARITTRPLMPRKVTDRISRRPSRPRMRPRSRSRQHLNRTSDLTITLGSVRSERQSTTLVHSSNNTDHHATHGRSMDKAYELPQRPMGLIRSRPRRSKSRGLEHKDRPRQGYMRPTKCQKLSDDLQKVNPHNGSQPAMEKHPYTETTARSLRPSTPPDASLVTQPDQVHQRHLAANRHLQRNISSEDIPQDPSRSISDQDLECDIIDLYADGYADNGEDDRLWKEVEGILQTMASPADSNETRLVSSPTRAMYVTVGDTPLLTPGTLAQAKPIHRHISRAFSVRGVGLHPDVSRVIHSLRDGTSLDSFVLERIHSCASSHG